MPHETELCFHLSSELFPCPWADSIPQLKHAHERLEGHLDDLKPPMPEYLQETVELCEGCNQRPYLEILIADAGQHWHYIIKNPPQIASG